jgi:molybdopterin converting factor small subunit
VAVDVELFGQLLPGAPRRVNLTLERPMTAQEVAIQLGLDPAEVGLVVIDGILSEIDVPVPRDCRLCFFPPVSGG